MTRPKQTTGNARTDVKRHDLAVTMDWISRGEECGFVFTKERKMLMLVLSFLGTVNLPFRQE